MTHRTETPCDDASRECSPPVTIVVVETAQVETCLKDPDIKPQSYSTPKQEMKQNCNTPKEDIQQDDFQQSIEHSITPTQITPLHAIPEKTKSEVPLSDIRPEFKKNSPMLRGARFCSEVRKLLMFSTLVTVCCLEFYSATVEDNDSFT